MGKNGNNGNSADRIRILHLAARNIKSVKAVDIDFDGDIHEVRGDSGQGKTTILQAIEGCLRGLDPDMIRKGATSAEIELHLTAATVKRIIGEDGADTLLAKDADGNMIAKAKDFLRTLCGPTAFRPLEWVALGGGEAKGKTERLRLQRKQLLEALPMSLSGKVVRAVVERALGEDAIAALDEVNLGTVDYDQHAFAVCAALTKACYEFRALQNALADDGEAKLSVLPRPERAAPKAPAAVLEAELEAARTAYLTAKGASGNLRGLTEQRDRLRAQIAEEAESIPSEERLNATEKAYQEQRDDLQGEIAQLELALAEKRAALDEVSGKLNRCAGVRRQVENHAARKADLARLEAEVSGADGGGVDLEALEAAGVEAKARLEARKAQDALDAAAQEAHAARARAQRYDALVEFFRDTLPRELLANAELPVEGLSVDADQILINGIPLHQLGTSQQIRVGVLIASRLNPTSAFILVDGAESMGKKDRAELAKVAHELGLQLIMTIVDPDAVPAPGVTVMEAGAALATVN